MPYMVYSLQSEDSDRTKDRWNVRASPAIVSVSASSLSANFGRDRPWSHLRVCVCLASLLNSKAQIEKPHPCNRGISDCYSTTNLEAID